MPDVVFRLSLTRWRAWLCSVSTVVGSGISTVETTGMTEGTEAGQWGESGYLV